MAERRRKQTRLSVITAAADTGRNRLQDPPPGPETPTAGPERLLQCRPGPNSTRLQARTAPATPSRARNHIPPGPRDYVAVAIAQCHETDNSGLTSVSRQEKTVSTVILCHETDNSTITSVSRLTYMQKVPARPPPEPLETALSLIQRR